MHRRRRADRVARRRRRSMPRSSRPPPAALRRGLSRTVELGGRSLFIEVFPVRPRLVIVGGVEVARSLVRLARELGFETVVVDGRAAFATPERFPDVDRARRRLAGRGRRRDRPRPERCRRRPVARRQVRRAGDRRGAPPRLPLRRRGRVEEDPGATGARACSRPASARRTWRGCAGRSASTWAAARRPRRPSRSSPRSSPSATAAPARRCANGCWRSPERGRRRPRARPRVGGQDAVHDRRDRVILAAGAGSRFGGGKLLATIGGRPVLQHVLDTLADAGRRATWSSSWARRRCDRGGDRRGDDERRVREPGARARPVELAPGRVSTAARRPTSARSSSRSATSRSCRSRPSGRCSMPPRCAAARSSSRPTRTSAGGTRSCSGAPAFGLVDEATGDRGLGPVLAAHPELVYEVPVAGHEPGRGHARRPRPGDRGVLGGSRARQPRAGRADPRGPRRRGLLCPGQLAVPRRPDADRRPGPGRPARTSSGRARRGSTSGPGPAGSPCRSPGRSDPSGGSVVALDASASMLEGLREIAEDYAIENVRTVEARWPPADAAERRGESRGGRRPDRPRRLRHRGDRAVRRRAGGGRRAPVRGGPDGAGAGVGRRPVLAAGPRRGARRRCRPCPTSLELLRGPRTATVGDPRRDRAAPVRVARGARRLRPAPALDRPAGPKEERFQAALDELAVRRRRRLDDPGPGPSDVGIVTWTPGDQQD